MDNGQQDQSIDGPPSPNTHTQRPDPPQEDHGQSRRLAWLAPTNVQVRQPKIKVYWMCLAATLMATNIMYGMSTVKTYQTTKRGPQERRKLCIFVQSHGVDYPPEKNFTHQRVVNAETWANGYGGQSNAEVSVSFVTDGLAPSGFDVISLNTSHFNYQQGPKCLWTLLSYLQNHNECDFYGLIDSDVYIQPRKILQALRHKDPNGELYAGSVWGGECGLFSHGLLILLSTKTLGGIELDQCERNWTSGWFDVKLGCCLKAQGILPTALGSYIVDNSGEETREKYATCTEEERSCAMSIHKVKPVDFSHLIHADIASIDARKSYNCTRRWNA